MPFVKVNINEEIKKKKAENKDFKIAYEIVEMEYELIEKAVNLRKQLGISQSEIAKDTGLTQQMVSRLEKRGNPPTLRNFLRYLDSMGLALKIEKK